MQFPSLPQMEAELAAPAPGLTPFSCAMLRNVTVEGLEPYLRYAGRRVGLDLSLAWGNHDNILQEASGEGSGAIDASTKAVVVCLWLPAFSELFAGAFAAASPETVEAETGRVLAYCSATIRALRTRTAAPIFWLGFERPAWPAYGIADARMAEGHRQVISELNTELADALAQVGSAYLIDTARCLERVGARQFYDWRYWYLARAPFSRAAMAELASEVSAHIRAATGRAKKCLVLDCDNTLWGGIVGEDGAAGIRLGTESPGAAYRDFQQEVLNLHHRGVVLALCSRNNEADVREVFRTRPEMVLREGHFAAARINWNDKATNLRELASELNLGLDSLVFADDSEFELGMVRAAAPAVETLALDSARPAEHRLRLASCDWFDVLTVTADDRARGERYLTERARRSAANGSVDLADYLRSLELRITVEDVPDADLDRAAQLCLRTNQFNLTTRRHTRQALESARASGASLLQLKVADRFGDYGIVGLSLILPEGETAFIDTFLVSCRVLGRGVESAFLAAVVEHAAARGTRQMRAAYVPTPKNAQVAGFYSRHGFAASGLADGVHRFSLRWTAGCVPVPEHLRAAAEHPGVTQ